MALTGWVADAAAFPSPLQPTAMEGGLYPAAIPSYGLQANQEAFWKLNERKDTGVSLRLFADLGSAFEIQSAATSNGRWDVLCTVELSNSGVSAISIGTIGEVDGFAS